ncbi:hypothetical protein K1719_043869 [Acacia pycnantha]|nr:hypothetical protein K1719_043869 [Acacia pycnantha]
MACLSYLQLLPLPRYHLNWSTYASSNLVQPRELRSRCKWGPLAIDASNAADVVKGKKVRTRKISKKEDVIMEDKGSEAEIIDQDEPSFNGNVEEEIEDDLELIKDDGEDISFTYGWPPLVCCFGSAQHAFVPSGRPANRLLNYEIHESMKDALWSPENFVRAPGGSASAVAIALSTLGGKVAFMGKLADDDYGQAMMYYMNVNNVQTRLVCIDSKRATTVSLMKIGKRGRLKMSCVKPCAEDCLTKSEINIDVLKEAKMFYFKDTFPACS